MVLDEAADYSLKDKIVVVTGGGSGICLSYVQIAHTLGAKIIIGDIKLTLEAEEFISKACSDRVVFQPCDVSKWDQLQKLVSTSEKKYGDVPDVWIAGAGVFEPDFSNFWDDPEETGYSETNINLSHPIKLTRIAIRSVLGKNKPGTVLIISSISGLRGNYGAPVYCATKWGIIGFVRSLAEAEKRENVRVMAICPGYVHTHLWTDRPNIMNDFSYAAENALLPIDVAERMVEMCQQKAKYGGGTVLETSVAGSRVIPQWNIDPPKITPLGPGTVDELLKKERGVALKSTY